MKTILILLLSAGFALANQLGDFINSSASFTRPGDTTAYASGDLVANSTTAGSVVTPDSSGLALSQCLRPATPR